MKSFLHLIRGRKPVWYSDYASKEGIDAAEQRFQNGLVWANIPEEEATHSMYIQNSDGSYRLAPEGIGYKGFPADALPNETENTADFFTRSGVGGEHSDYTKVAERNGIKLMQFEDEQKLNPQWKMASKIKDKLHIEDNSKAGRFVDYFGGKPMDWLLGYKPFTIKQNYLHNDRAILPIFNDPNDTYVPNWVVAGSVGRQ